jgi:uncharacterized metal-binding protein
MNCASCKEKTCYKGKDCTKIAEDVKIAYKGDALNSLRVATRMQKR